MRNDVLHKDGTSIHQHDLRKLNEAVEDEFVRGLDTLPQSDYSHLFKGSLESMMAYPHLTKRLWITSVWSARQKFSAGYTHLSHPEVSLVYDKWKSKVSLPFSSDDEDIEEEDEDDDV